MHQRVWQRNSWDAPPRLRSGSQRHPEKSVGLRQTVCSDSGPPVTPASSSSRTTLSEQLSESAIRTACPSGPRGTPLECWW